MGGNVEEILMIHRNAFSNNFNMQNWVDEYVEAFFEVLTNWAKSDKELNQKISEWYEKCYELSLIELLYTENAEKCYEAVDLLGENEYSALQVDICKKTELKKCRIKAKKVCEKLKSILGEDSDQKQQLVFRVYGELSNEKKKYISSIVLKDDNGQNNEQEEGGTSSINNYLLAGGCIIENRNVCKMLEECGKFDYNYFRISSEQGTFFCMIKKKTEKKNVVSSISFKEFCINSYRKSKEGRYYQPIYAENFYKKIYVSCIPFMKSMDEGMYILSPINRTIYDKIEIEMFSGNKHNRNRLSWDEFRDIVYNDQGYASLICWVVNHQVDSQRYNEDEIRKEYEVYLQDIYRYNFEEYD